MRILRFDPIGRNHDSSADVRNRIGRGPSTLVPEIGRRLATRSVYALPLSLGNPDAPDAPENRDELIAPYQSSAKAISLFPVGMLARAITTVLVPNRTV
jgi:hypothetical protein